MDLWFLGKTISRDPLLHLQWGELRDRDTERCKCIDDDTSCMGDIDTIGYVSEEKKSLDPTRGRMISIDDLSEVSRYLDETLRQWESRLSRYDSILDNARHSPLFFYESKSSCRSSWIDAEDNHEGIILLVSFGEKKKILTK